MTDNTNFVMNSYIPELAQISQHFHIKILYCNVIIFADLKGVLYWKCTQKNQHKLWRWPSLKM